MSAQDDQDGADFGQDNAVKRAPGGFEVDDQDLAQDHIQDREPRNIQGSKGGKGDERGARRKSRSKSAKRKKSKGKNGNNMLNKSYGQSDKSMISDANADPEQAKDFQAAYQKLLEKLSQEQDGNSKHLINKEELAKLERMKQLNEEEFMARLNQFEENKRQKIMKRLDDIKDKDLDECTFKPQMVTTDGQPKRSVNQFLEDQNKFLEKKEKNWQDRKAIEEQAQTTPAIDQGSKKMIEGMGDRKSKPTYERLYGLNKEKKQKEEEKNALEAAKPKPTTQRHVDKELYEDAARRLEESKKKKQEFDKVKDQPKEKMYKNDQSEKYVIQRFEKEMKQVVQATKEQKDDQDENKEEEEVFNYDQVLVILKLLGFLSEQQASQEVEKELSEFFWEFVHGEEQKGVSEETLKMALLIIIGVSQREGVPSSGDENQDEEKKDSASQFSFFDQNDKFCVKKGEQKKVFTLFKTFYINRVQNVGLKKVETQEAKGEQKPTISNKSSQMAQNKRKKLMGENATIQDVLCQPVKKTDQQWIDSEKKKIEDKKVEGCTFKPKTNEKYAKGGQRDDGQNERWMQLYSKTQKGQYADKTSKTAKDYEEERNGGECSFKPQINAGSPNVKKTQGLNDIKGMDKALERLNKGRELHNQKRMMTERGIPAQIKGKIEGWEQEAQFVFTQNNTKFGGFDKSLSQVKRSKSPQRPSKVDNSKKKAQDEEHHEGENQDLHDEQEANQEEEPQHQVEEQEMVNKHIEKEQQKESAPQYEDQEDHQQREEHYQEYREEHYQEYHEEHYEDHHEEQEYQEPDQEGRKLSNDEDH